MDFEWSLKEAKWNMRNKVGEIKNELLGGRDIRCFFGERMESLGFVSYKDGKSWYALKDDTLFFTVLFHHDYAYADIFVRVCPVCAELIYPFNNTQGAFYDQINHSISACVASNLKPSNYVGKEGTLRYFKDLLDSVVVPYVDSFISLCEAPLESLRNEEDKVRFAYLRNDVSMFYKSDVVRSALFSEAHDLGSERYELRKALIEKDMTIYGKYLQKVEASNLGKLKKRLPELFRSAEPLMTDDYVARKAISECKTTHEYISELKDAGNTADDSFHPMPMLLSNKEIASSDSKEDAERAVKEIFGERMKAQGFKMREDYPYGVLWQRVVNSTAVQSVWFEWNPHLLDLSVFYHPSARINVKEYACRQGALSTESKYYELFDLPNLHEHFPNPFSNGDAVYEWQKRVLEIIISRIVMPSLK